jgi:hypothetical protein
MSVVRPVWATRLRPAPCDGFALLSVILIVALLGLIAVPMLEVTRKTQERGIKQRLTAQLNKEAKEYLEVGIFDVQTAGGIPDTFTRVQSPSLRKLAALCDNRVRAIDPDMLGLARLTDNSTVYNTQVTITKNRQVAQFIVDKTIPGNSYQRYALVSCAAANDGSIGVYGGEVASIKRSYYTLKFGQF